MKGASNVIWIVVVTLLALVVLIVLVGPIVQGGDTAKDQLSMSDAINCCNSCWAANPDGNIGGEVKCPVAGSETSPLTGTGGLCKKVLGKECEYCSDIPFCSRG
ncbi:MAG: hypothetical protein KJ697_04265 [Nanoarchaeota archaeon]|nr:hypothetical protein [Nanoarchaeota archaeon]